MESLQRNNIRKFQKEINVFLLPFFNDKKHTNRALFWTAENQQTTNEGKMKQFLNAKERNKNILTYIHTNIYSIY